jgi:hypothetical protein
MSLAKHIKIETIDNLNDNIYKKMIINRIFSAVDLSNIVKDFLFITAEEKKIREIKQSIHKSFTCAYLSRKKMGDDIGSWCFCENYYSSHFFQGINCKFCGEYISTRTYDTDELCANNARCECVYMNLAEGLQFNWTYNEIV